MSGALISVLMSAYNERPEWLRAAMESILGQTHGDLELIVVLDAPDNAALESVIRQYAAGDGRVVFLKNAENRGLVYCLNRAADAARGLYLARMDADDISVPHRLETQLDALRREELDLVAGNILRMEEDGTLRDDPAAPPVCQGKALGSWPALLRVRNFVAHPTWLLRAEAFRAVGPYHEIPRAEDYEWLCRAALRGLRMRKLGQPLLYYRLRDGSVSTGGAYAQKRVTYAVRRQYRRALARGGQLDGAALARSIGRMDLTRGEARYRGALAAYHAAWDRPLPGRIAGLTRAFLASPILIRQPFEDRRMRHIEGTFS